MNDFRAAVHAIEPLYLTVDFWAGFGLFWACFGQILVNLLAYFGHVLDRFSVSFCHVSAFFSVVLGECPGYVFSMFTAYFGHI